MVYALCASKGGSESPQRSRLLDVNALCAGKGGSESPRGLALYVGKGCKANTPLAPVNLIWFTRTF